jgi:MFS transporter, DHA1 family, solute carrier family 18 (vesicular amine transporter), member 1/2
MRRVARDPVAFGVHGLIVVASMTQNAVVPLLPTFEQRYGLTTSGVAWVLALPSLAMLVTALPIGVVCDRWGARRVTTAAALLLVLASVLQAIPVLALLLAGRAMFGLAFTAIWTSGPAWLSAPERRPEGGRIGAVVTSSAAGSIAAPVLAGFLADRIGLAAPFVALAVLSAGLAVVVCTTAGDSPSGRPAAGEWWRLARHVSRSRGMISAAVAMVAVGAVWGSVQLLVPLQLNRLGESSSALGAVLSVAGIGYVVVSAITARASDRFLTGWAVVIGCLGLAVAVIPGAVGTYAPALIACLLLVAVARAQLNTVSYPLAARTQAAGVGMVMGVLNLLWAASMTVGPIAAGALSDWLGVRPALVITATLPAALAIGLAVLLSDQPASAASAIAGRAR